MATRTAGLLKNGLFRSPLLGVVAELKEEVEKLRTIREWERLTGGVTPRYTREIGAKEIAPKQ